MRQLPDTFAALGDKTRFAIVERLLSEGETSAGTLCADFEISAPAVSRHLKVLRKSGLVSQKVQGQKRLYSVRAEAVREISLWTMNYKEFWQSSLDRLEEALNNEKSE